MLSFIRKHLPLAVYTVGAGIVTLWTVLRFVTQRTIFDLVGQQVVAQQLAHGQGSGASIGVTNYMLKMILLYMPMNALPGSPRLKLILLTVVVNVATFVLIGVLLQKLLREFKIKVGPLLYVGLLWLAMVAGSVFWIQFTNSRNLEVAGGLLLILLVIRYQKKPTWRRAGILAAYGAVLFFADNLQLYMTAVPLLLYVAILAWRRRTSYQVVIQLAGLLLAGFVGSKLLFWLFGALLHVQYLTADTGLHASLHNLIGVARAYRHLLVGGADAGRLREAMNTLLLTGLLGWTFWQAIRRQLPRSLVLLVACVIVIDSIVFGVSGNASQNGTERYLIMTVPALLLLISATPLPRRLHVSITAAVTLITLVNIGALGGTLLHAWPTRFSSDDHLAVVQAYRPAGAIVYASMDTAIPTAYLSGSYTKAPLPLSCNNGRLQRNMLFYARQAYTTREAQSAKQVALVFDGTTITNVPNVCNESSVTAQLGQPQARTALSDGSLVLMYPPSVMQKL